MKKAKILIIDDMPELLKGFGMILEDAGYEVVTASTYEEGKQQANESHPDLLLVDIRLGEYNGLQLVAREHAGQHRPVIVMSGHPDPYLEEEARRLGAEYVAKPVAPGELLALIKKALLARRAMPH